MRDKFLFLTVIFGLLFFYYIISPLVGILDYKNHKDVCLEVPMEACYLKVPALCSTFESPCSVPTGWYVPEAKPISI